LKLQKEKKLLRISKIISDNPNAGILSWATEEQIDIAVISPKNFPNEEEFGKELIRLIGDTDLVVLAGYLKKIPDNVIHAYENRIVNIHPALLPAFGGKGYYGMKVHKAVFEYGVKVSGITIHLVDAQFDHGPILFQMATSIEDCSSPEEISEKVLRLEHKYYSQVIEKILTQGFKLEGRRVIWNP
jgi:formyltetrahydrofolate-dependent phosphoribosylglycinamide formyltransferase